ncbi:MAG: VCBS repeat-containing protein [Pirellulaceae bacterium]
MHLRCIALLAGIVLASTTLHVGAAEFQRLKHRQPGLEVDLGVGLWALPLPMDHDGDGDYDLVVICPDAPYNGAWLFENPGGENSGGDAKAPVFKPAVRLDRGMHNVTVSLIDGQPRVMSPGVEYVDFRKNAFGRPHKLESVPAVHPSKVRANQWKYADYDGDGALDLIVGVGDWAEYGWDDAFDKQGRWQRGPLHGYVYLLRNAGSSEKPKYEAARKIEADGAPVDVYGAPSPNLADFDGDGDLDLLCGEFVDTFNYFQNIGTRTEPRYAAGRKLAHDGQPIAMDLEMIVPVAVDWDRDGDVDLVVGQEDGRVALLEHTGKVRDGLPQFLPPVFFRQQADEVKFGALVTPFAIDWDGDGDEDLLCGNTAGYVGLIENLDGKFPPKLAEPRYLQTDGKPLRIMAGENGSIQGPCEAKWGYTTLSAADWDGDGLPDVIVNSIWGKIEWYRNIGTRSKPVLEAARPVQVDWEAEPQKPAWNWWTPKDDALATQWRTTPLAEDFNGDGLRDLLLLDHEGYLCLLERRRDGDRLVLSPPRRIFAGRGAHGFDNRQRVKDKGDGLLQLNVGTAGASGRRKFCLADWDGDGRKDLLINSENINFLKNVGDTPEGGYVFEDQGSVSEQRLAGHTTSPTVVDWNRDGLPDLIAGAEDGRLYYLPNPKTKRGK